MSDEEKTAKSPAQKSHPRKKRVMDISNPHKKSSKRPQVATPKSTSTAKHSPQSVSKSTTKRSPKTTSKSASKSTTKQRKPRAKTASSNISIKTPADSASQSSQTASSQSTASDTSSTTSVTSNQSTTTSPTPPSSKESSKSSAKHPKKPWSTTKKVVLGIVLVLLAGIIAIVAYFLTYAYNVLDKTTEIFEGDALDILKLDPLKQDANGYTNILVFGTSEDDGDHGGALLADSILVVSVDQTTKRAAMFSIPRDLWVPYGMYCSVGYKGKINAGYYCGLETHDDDKKAAAEDFERIVQTVTGLDFQYYVAVNYTVVREVTNQLGGIDVDIYTDDPRGIYDNLTLLNLPPGVNHLDGELALSLARSRNSHGGYGLSRSNFDREINQQRIISAMLHKATNVGILADSSKVMGILDALGNNIITNVPMSEVRTAIDIASNLAADPVSIDTSSLFTTGSVNGASYVFAAAGQENYSYIQAYIAEQLKATLTSPAPVTDINEPTPEE